MVNFDGCTPLDIVCNLHRTTSQIDPLLRSLGALSAQAVREIERQESQEYDPTHDDLSSADPPSPSFTPLGHEHHTVRNRFGFESQLLQPIAMDSEAQDDCHLAVTASRSDGGWEFHDSREEGSQGGLLKGNSSERFKVKGHREVTQTHQSDTPESVPEGVCTCIVCGWCEYCISCGYCRYVCPDLSNVSIRTASGNDILYTHTISGKGYLDMLGPVLHKALCLRFQHFLILFNTRRKKTESPSQFDEESVLQYTEC